MLLDASMNECPINPMIDGCQAPRRDLKLEIWIWASSAGGSNLPEIDDHAALGKCFFNSTLKGSAKTTADMYYAQSTLHGFPFDAVYLPRRAGGTLISFLFFSLSLLASFQLK